MDDKTYFWPKYMLPFLSAMFIPFIPMLHLYKQNASYIDLSHVLAVSCVMSVLSAALYVIVHKVYKIPLLAIFSVAIWWILFFLWGYVYDAGQQFGVRYRTLLVAAFLIFCGIIIVAGFFRKHLRGSVITTGACVFIGVLIIFNLSGAIFSATRTEKISYLPDSLQGKHVIDEALPSPNIYWILCDGMLGFDAMEKHFGDAQEDFAASLESKVFVINKSARFGDHWSTILSVPALMSPEYYDNYLSNGSRENLTMARLNNELIGVFESKGYQTVTIATSDQYFFPTVSRFYDLWYPDHDYMLVNRNPNQSKEEIFTAINSTIRLNSLHSLLKHTLLLPFKYKITREIYSRGAVGERVQIPAPIGIPDDIKDNTIIWALADSMSAQGPKLTIVHNMTAHSPFSRDENGNPSGNDPLLITSYHAQHIYAAKLIDKMVDYIMAMDPDAIIVLQADHGLQLQSKENITKAFGEAAVPDIWNNVMSAVRIPAQYGDLTEPLNPLDISRYLVNNYVGENYAYLE